MKLAGLLLATLALARAASIPDSIAFEQKKLPAIDEIKETIPAENVSSEQELIDSANAVKDIENNLRVKAIDSIPVSVIVDGDVSNPVENEVTPEIKRVPIDLNNPGEPQRQEHETQNAVHYDEEQQIVTTVKQTVLDTENALKQGFQGIAQGFQNWIANNEQLSAIQASINNLQENFHNQISKLNSTIHSFWNNRVGSEPPALENVEQNPEIESVQSHLRILENNFQTGVKALSEGVQVYASLKAENENPSSPAPVAPSNLLVQYLQLFQNTLTQGFNNVTHAIQNYVGQGANHNNTSSSGGLLQSFNNGFQNIFSPSSSTPSNVQSDVEGSTARPTIWQGIQSSLQNILNPGQAQNQASGGQGSNGTPNRPIAQAIQNLPFVQGVVSLIQPNKPAAQPAAQPAQPAQPSQAVPVAPVQPEKPAEVAPVVEQGSNVVPVPEKPESDVKEPAKEPVNEPAKEPAKVPVKEPQAAPEQANNNGPIRNIIQNNPIVKGISGAVQRLQASIGNPEKPREGEQAPEKQKNEDADVKGHYGGHNTNNAGDNKLSSGVVKSVPVNEEKIVEAVPEDIKIVEEPKPQVESEKTEQS